MKLSYRNIWKFHFFIIYLQCELDMFNYKKKKYGEM